MVGKDFPKLAFNMFGLDLLEPMAIVLDFALALVSFYLAYKISKFTFKSLFYSTWKLFFVFFGISTFFGALGHGLFNYFGIYGMFPAWLIAPLSIYLIEIAVINGHWNFKITERLKKVYLIKLVLVYLVFFVVYFSASSFEKPDLFFLPIAINSIIGLFIGVGYFGFKLKQKQSISFKYFVGGILVIFPSAFIFLLKINIHPWFNKNDFSHLLMILGIVCFYLGVSNLNKEKFKI